MTDWQTDSHSSPSDALAAGKAGAVGDGRFLSGTKREAHEAESQGSPEVVYFQIPVLAIVVLFWCAVDDALVVAL